MSDLAIQQVLAQMRQMKIEAGSEAGRMDASEKPDFAEMLNRSIAEVNEAQQASSDLKEAFTRGDPETSLAEVMIASQKSRVSFEAMVQVRNRLVEAYREIQRMQI
jgi:flagellar hook-basal body complex protein FliE